MKWYAIHGISLIDVQVPIKKYTVQVKGYRILIIYKDSKWYAVNEECPHAGKSLLKGFCSDADTITCPYHNFAFHLQDGRCTNNNEGFKLRIFPTKIENETIFVQVPD